MTPEKQAKNATIGSPLSPGSIGMDATANLICANPVNEVGGVRIPSYAGVDLTYRLGVKAGR